MNILAILASLSIATILYLLHSGKKRAEKGKKEFEEEKKIGLEKKNSQKFYRGRMNRRR